MLKFLLLFILNKLIGDKTGVSLMDKKLDIEIQQINVSEDCKHNNRTEPFYKKLLKTYIEALVTSSPTLEFGIAFCEASGDCLIRHDGNKEDLEEKAIEYAKQINAGHVFVILLRKGYPINVLNRVKNVQEVCRVFAATANPLQVLIANTDQGRGVIWVVDGFKTTGVENKEDQKNRKYLLREIIGYKR